MTGLLPRRIVNALLTAIGTTLALLCLLIQKLHFLTFGQLTRWLGQRKLAKRAVAVAPATLSTLLIGSSLWIGYMNQRPGAGWAAALTAVCYTASLVAVDFVVTELMTVPSILAEAASAAAAHPVVGRLLLHLRDQRDAPLVMMTWNICVLVGSFAFFVLLTGRHISAYAFVILSTIIWLRSVAVFAIIEHIDVHQKILSPRKQSQRSPAKLLLYILAFCHRWILCLFFGIFPYWSVSSHVACHHLENNGPNDFLSVQSYNRTSFPNFGLYYANILLTLLFSTKLYNYFKAKNRPVRVKKLTYGIFYRTAVLLIILWTSPAIGILLLFTMVGFAYNIAITGLVDHGFSDPQDPQNLFQNSYNQIWNLDDHGFYGDVYHLQHHLTPGQWLGLEDRVKARELPAGAFVVQNLVLPDDMLCALWQNDPTQLFPFVQSVGGRRPTAEEFHTFFHARTRPEAHPAESRWERLISRAAGVLVGIGRS